MRYSKEVTNYFFDIRHAGTLDRKSVNMYYGEVGSVLQGYLCQLYLRFKDDKIIEAKFQAYGSPMITAACEYACRWGEGRAFGEVKQLNADQIKNALNLRSFEFYVSALIEQLWKKTILGKNNLFYFYMDDKLHEF